MEPPSPVRAGFRFYKVGSSNLCYPNLQNRLETTMSDPRLRQIIQTVTPQIESVLRPYKHLLGQGRKFSVRVEVEDIELVPVTLKPRHRVRKHGMRVVTRR